MQFFYFRFPISKIIKITGITYFILSNIKHIKSIVILYFYINGLFYFIKILNVPKIKT